MVQLIRNNGIFFAKKRLEYPTIGIETGGIQNSIFHSHKTGNFFFEFFMNILCSANEPHRRHSVTMRIHHVLRSFYDLRITSESKIIVGTEIKKRLSIS